MLSFDEGGNQNIYSYICSRPSFIYYVDSLLFLSDWSNRNMKSVCQIPSLPFHAPAAKNQRWILQVVVEFMDDGCLLQPHRKL
jgi:hypothetical protein